MESNLKLGESNENAVSDIEKSIACQKKTKTALESAEHDWQIVLDAADIKRD